MLQPLFARPLCASKARSVWNAIVSEFYSEDLCSVEEATLLLSLDDPARFMSARPDHRTVTERLKHWMRASKVLTADAVSSKSVKMSGIIASRYVL